MVSNFPVTSKYKSIVRETMRPKNSFKHLNALRVAFKNKQWLSFSSWYKFPRWKISLSVKGYFPVFATFVLFRMPQNNSIHASKLYPYANIILVVSNNQMGFLY